MLAHPNPRSVCIHRRRRRSDHTGGGEIRDVHRIVMVDIDGELIEVCRRYLLEWSAGAYEDPRLELLTGDGRRHLGDWRDLRCHPRRSR